MDCGRLSPAVSGRRWRRAGARLGDGQRSVAVVAARAGAGLCLSPAGHRAVPTAGSPCPRDLTAHLAQSSL